MSQHDYSVANDTGANVRADLNNALQALASISSGASAPSTTYAYQWWGDTTNSVLKRRNAANSGWIVVRTLSESFVLSKTTAYTVVLADFAKTILCDASGGAFTVTLPAAATAGDGYKVTVKKSDSSANAVTVDGNSSETIDGATTKALSSQYDAIVLACDGSNWHLVADNAQFASVIRQNSKSAAYTMVLGDGGYHVLHPSADTSARTFTIPANSSVAYSIGTAITIVNQDSAGVVTIAITTDTMRLAGAGTTGSRTLAANGIATALKVTATEWIISGTGLT